MGSLEPTASLLGQRAPSPPLSQVFQTRAASADYLRPRIPSPVGKYRLSICPHCAAPPTPVPPLQSYTCPLELAKSFFISILKVFKKKCVETHMWKIVYYPTAQSSR